MTLYEKIQALCRNEGFEISNIGERISGVNITRGSISKWKSGAIPRAATVKAIADYFGVSVEYLTNDKTTMEQQQSKELNDIFSIPNIFPIKTKKVPLLGDIACGEPIFANEEHGEYISTSDDIDADFCLRAQGKSMIGARINEGDIVFIRKQPQVENGQIAAVLIGDNTTLKRVYYYPEKQKLVLTPENPDFEPQVYVGEELAEVRILGRAVAFQSIVR